MNPWAIAIGAALGAVKAQGEEKKAHEARKVEATKSRWSTFTGKTGENVAAPDHMGRIMQGAMTGAMMGQGMGGGEAAAGAGGNAYAATGNVAQGAGAGAAAQMPGAGAQNMMMQPRNMYA